MRLLVIEDDRLLNNTLCYNLSAAGYTVDAAMSKSAAVEFCEAQDYDLIVLDVNLPDGNGFDFCTEIKERRPDTAVIFLTANDMESDMLKGFELGADDYVTKPFRPLELIARVKAQLRRYNKYSPTQKQDVPATVLTYKKLSLNTQTYECVLDGEIVPLTPTEFSILRILLEKQGVVVSLEDLFHSVWKDEYYSKNSSTITVHIRHLREKLKDTAEKPKYIKTIWGVGYKI